MRDTLLVEVCTSLWDNQKSGILFFPNPVNNRLLITSISKIDAGPIRLFSYSGALVYTGYWNGKQIEIPVTDFADGLYLLQAEGEHIKVLIQH